MTMHGTILLRHSFVCRRQRLGSPLCSFFRVHRAYRSTGLKSQRWVVQAEGQHGGPVSLTREFKKNVGFCCFILRRLYHRTSCAVLDASCKVFGCWSKKSATCCWRSAICCQVSRCAGPQPIFSCQWPKKNNFTHAIETLRKLRTSQRKAIRSWSVKQTSELLRASSTCSSCPQWHRSPRAKKHTCTEDAQICTSKTTVQK